MTKEVRRLVGANLRAARLAARLKQEDVATEIGRSRQTISSWETGNTMPSVEELREVLVYLGTSADLVLFNVEDVAAARDDAVRRAQARASIAA